MKTTQLNFVKMREAHRHIDGRDYCVDALIDRIIKKPRRVKELNLGGWKTGRSLGEVGGPEHVLLNPHATAHRYLPTNLSPKLDFPVLVCKRGGSEIIVDGVHRVARTLQAEQASYPCIYVTYRELKKCLLKST